jgi:hypothetical protein
MRRPRQPTGMSVALLAVHITLVLLGLSCLASVGGAVEGKLHQVKPPTLSTPGHQRPPSLSSTSDSPAKAYAYAPPLFGQPSLLQSLWRPTIGIYFRRMVRLQPETVNTTMCEANALYSQCVQCKRQCCHGTAATGLHQHDSAPATALGGCPYQDLLLTATNCGGVWACTRLSPSEAASTWYAIAPSQRPMPTLPPAGKAGLSDCDTTCVFWQLTHGCYVQLSAPRIEQGRWSEPLSEHTCCDRRTEYMLYAHVPAKLPTSDTGCPNTRLLTWLDHMPHKKAAQYTRRELCTVPAHPASEPCPARRPAAWTSSGM